MADGQVILWVMQAEASHPTLTPHWVLDVICPLNPAATSVFPART